MRSDAKRKRSVLHGLLAHRRTTIKEATDEATKLRDAMDAAEIKHTALASEAHAASAAAAAAQSALEDAEGRVAAAAEQLVTHQRKLEAERQRASAVEAQLAGLQKEIEDREGRLADGSRGVAAQASIVSLQLELTSAREQERPRDSNPRPSHVAAAVMQPR